MIKRFYSHYRKEDDIYQYNDEHQRHVADLAQKYCPLTLMKGAAWLLGMHHDDGKNTAQWQEYFEKSVNAKERFNEGKVDHSTLGGLVVNAYVPGTCLSEMLQNAIYMHHGLLDCVSASDGSVLLLKRKGKYTAELVDKVRKEAKEQFQDIDMTAEFAKADSDVNKLTRQLIDFVKSDGGIYGNRHFYLGMCERVLFSSLMDADWRDTADFMADRKTTVGMEQDEIQKVWEKGKENLEKRLNGLDSTTKIGGYRKKISDQCRSAALSSGNLYRLAVPTGAGKTLSSLRFALYCAGEKRKRHIFYIAPYKSILDQNAEEISVSLGMPEMVLEHHSDVVQEKEEDLKIYERLIENWDEVPVIVTTAVQFFQTLYKEKRSSVRRFHSLCDSVIILDEVQAIPVKLLELCNLAVNFLTKFCNTTVVLCTATQPLLDRLGNNRMLPPEEMTGSISEYEEAFRRVEYHDCTEECKAGLDSSQAAEFVLEKAEQFDQILMIVNTKACAKRVYEELKDHADGYVYHLSTFMCAQHRSDILGKIRKALAQKKKVICISTQLVEAGVDFSFQCVIRSLAGLDNLIQAAGRCNRDGSADLGHVFLIKMSEEAEKISSLPDIKKAQEAMLRFLHVYRLNRKSFGYRMDTEKAIQEYYLQYLTERKEETAYPAKIDGVSTTLVDAFSQNSILAPDVKGYKLKQAFQSAGKAFSVIEENGGTDVLVPYGASLDLIQKLQESNDVEQKRQNMRKLQRYSVSLSENMLRKLGNAVYGIEDNRVLVLAEGYYNDNTGVQGEPAAMPFLSL